MSEPASDPATTSDASEASHGFWHREAGGIRLESGARSEVGTGIPGEVLLGDGPIEINPGRPVLTLWVANTGDRPIQVGSHYHFAEANPALAFDRGAARGHRLGIPAGTSVRFEPGIERDVDLVPFGGARIAAGFRGEVGGALDPPGAPEGRHADRHG